MSLGIVAMIISVIPMCIMYVSAYGEITIGMLLICVLTIVSSPIMGFCIFGMTFKFGKIILGVIAPIPLLSAFIEYFKGLYYGVKAIIVIVKKRDELVIGQPAE